MLAAELKFPDVPNKYSWLSLAQGVFNTQADRWDTQYCGGGLRWQIFTYQAGYSMKNTISNGVLFQLAARLARYTNNQTYSDWAEKIYDWTESSTLLNNKTWTLADSGNLEDNCKTPGNTQWSYNYGTYIMGATYMYDMVSFSLPGFPKNKIQEILGLTKKQTKDKKWLKVVNGLLETSFREFFPKKNDGGNTMEEPCEPLEVCNNNEILFKGLVTSWFAYVAQFIPDTKDRIKPKLQASARAAADSCSGMNNNTCGVRWYQHKWDGWNGMEEQIIASNALLSNLIIDSTDKSKNPVTADTGGNSESDPNAGQGTSSDNSGTHFKKITGGDKAGAGILAALFVGVWAGMVAFMITGG